MSGLVDQGTVARAYAEAEASYTRYSLVLQLNYLRINRLPFWGTPPHGEMWHGEPGHYWIEIDHGDPAIRESYGWYPANPVAYDPWYKMLDETAGVLSSDAPGCINGDSPARQMYERRLVVKPGQEHAAGGGIGTKPFPWDPHHGNKPASVSNPWISASRAKEDVIARIRSFAAGYAKSSNGLWTYRVDGFGENNCHTFIWKLLAECELADFNLLDSATDPHFFSADPAVFSHPVGPAWMNDLRTKTQKFKDALEGK